MQATEPNWYGTLTAGLTPEQQKALQEVIVLADQRKAALESKRIEQSGGKSSAINNKLVPLSEILKLIINSAINGTALNKCTAD